MEYEESLEYLKNCIGSTRDKSLHEEILAKNLDIILQNNNDEFFNLDIRSLYNIFHHKNRKLFDHNLAYFSIIEHSRQNDKDKLFTLLEALDGSKLSKSNLNDSILKRKERKNFMPNIDYLEIIKMNEQISFLQKNYQKQSILFIRFIYFFFFLLFLITIAYVCHYFGINKTKIFYLMKNKSFNSIEAVDSNDESYKTFQYLQIEIINQSLSKSIELLNTTLINHKILIESINASNFNLINLLDKKIRVLKEDMKAIKNNTNNSNTEINSTLYNIKTGIDMIKKNNINTSVLFDKEVKKWGKKFQLIKSSFFSSTNSVNLELQNLKEEIQMINNSYFNSINPFNLKLQNLKEEIQMINNSYFNSINPFNLELQNLKEEIQMINVSYFNLTVFVHDKLQEQLNKNKVYDENNTDFEGSFNESYINDKNNYFFADINISSHGILYNLKQRETDILNPFFIFTKSANDIYNIIDPSNNELFSFEYNRISFFEFTFKKSFIINGIKLFFKGDLAINFEIYINDELIKIIRQTINNHQGYKELTIKFDSIKGNFVNLTQIPSSLVYKFFQLKRIEFLSSDIEYSDGYFSTILSKYPKCNIHNCGFHIRSVDHLTFPFYSKINKNSIIINSSPENQWFQIELTKGSAILHGFVLKKSELVPLKNFKIIATNEYTDNLSSWKTLFETKTNYLSKDQKIFNTYKFSSPSTPIRFIRFIKTGPNWNKCDTFTIEYFDLYGYYIPILFDESI